MKSKNYEEFVEKFKPKKTTDDCYTPPVVYEAVKNWAVDEYGLQGRKIERPFYPGGDYEKYKYTKESVVIDNPPFSILRKIVNFYNSQNIKYFLFAPGLMLFNYCIDNEKTCAIIIKSEIIYENGARVNTGFITNLDKSRVRTAPDLSNILKQLQKKKNKRKKMNYPKNVISAASLGKYSKIPLRIENDEIKFIRNCGIERQQIFGCGGLISDYKAAEIKAAEIKAAEIKAAEIKAAEVIELTQDERDVINRLNRNCGLRKS